MTTTNPNSPFLTFLTLWYESGIGQATCKTLLPIAEEAGVDLGNATVERGRQTVLGQMLSARKGTEIGGFRIDAIALTVDGQSYRVSKTVSPGDELASSLMAITEAAEGHSEREGENAGKLSLESTQGLI